MSDLLHQLRAAAWDARLNFAPTEEQELLTGLEEVLVMVNELKKELDTTGETPLFFPPLPLGRMEEDRPGKSLPREVALANAPDAGYTCFHVPRIVVE